jgi:hypothetical protein
MNGGAAHPARLPAPPDRAGLVRGGIGEMTHRDRGHRRTVHRLLPARHVPIRTRPRRSCRAGAGHAAAGALPHRRTRSDHDADRGETLIRGVACSGAAPIDRVEVSFGDGPGSKSAAGSGGNCRPVSIPQGWSPCEPKRPTWPGGPSRINRRGTPTAAATTPSRKRASTCAQADPRQVVFTIDDSTCGSRSARRKSAE